MPEATSTATFKISETVTLTATDANNCKNSTTASITVNLLPTASISGNLSICSGGSTSLSGDGGTTYLWNPGLTTSSSTIFKTAGTVSLTATDANNCSNSTTAQITENPLPEVNLGKDTLVCAGTVFNLSAGNSGMNYLWSTGETKQAVSLVSTGKYWVDVTNANGCASTDSIELTFSNCSLVWPGDADNNLVVDNYDLLPLGLYYNQTGQQRDSISNVWLGQTCNEWSANQSNGMNLKFADCNGDGTINSNDTTAIHLNRSFTHNKKSDVLAANATDPNLYFTIADSNFAPGSYINIDLWTGDASNKITNMYGLAFDIGFNPDLIEADKTTFSFPVNYFGDGLLTFIKVDESAGKIYGAITRTNHTNVDGYGKIASLKFKIKNTLPALSDFPLSILNYKAIDAIGLTKTFNTPENNSITIDPELLNVATWKEDESLITIFPNPNTGRFTIKIENQRLSSNTTIIIYDLLGNTISSLKLSSTQTEIDLSSQAKGIYYLKIADKEGYIGAKKIVIQ